MYLCVNELNLGNIEMKTQRFLLSLFIGLVISSISGQQNKTKNIFDTLRTPDATTGASVTFFQDQRIESLFHQKDRDLSHGIVYRVQVFSSNNQRTARSQAFDIEKQLKESFPEQQVTVSYVSPFWKVRVGAFGTRADAQDLRENVVKTLPNLRNQIYVITDRSGLR